MSSFPSKRCIFYLRSAFENVFAYVTAAAESIGAPPTVAVITNRFFFEKHVDKNQFLSVQYPIDLLAS